MQLKFGSLEIELSRIELILSLNSVPSLHLLTEERFNTSIIKEILNGGERAKLEYQDDTLEILPIGFGKSDDKANENETFVHAILLEPSLETWFTTKPDAPKELNYGIHQNQSDVGGWTFLNSCLGYQFLTPINNYKERIDKILPISTCLTRPIRQDNQQYLGTVMGYLQHHLPELMGWTAVHAEHEALRFIFFNERNAFELDESWENLSASLPLRFASDSATRTELRKTGFQVQADKKMALLKTLAQHGIQTPLSGFLEAGSEDELLYLPGPVKLGEKVLLCKSITYSFAEENDTLTTTLELSSGLRTPASTVSSSRFEGMFKAWDADDAEEVRVFLATPDDTTWQMMDSKDSNLLNPSADLMAEFLLPTTPSDEFSGMYVRRVDGDRLVFKIENFKTPTIYGSHQVLTEKLEAATVSLNTEVLALSGAPKDTGINDMQGIVANAETIMHRTDGEVKAEAGTITLVKNIQVKKDSLSIVSKTDIASGTSVDKVKVSGIPGMTVIPAAGINYPIKVNKIGVKGMPAVSAQTVSPGGPSQQNDSDDELSWITFSLVDEDGQPLAEKNYKIVLPNGDIVRGQVPASGEVEVRDIPSGICQISFYDVVEGTAIEASEAPVAEQEQSWIEIELVDENDEPVAGEVYQITLADGQVKEGVLDEKGSARLEDVEAGKCEIMFPNVDSDAWNKTTQL